jgi:hypothetical protein
MAVYRSRDDRLDISGHPNCLVFLKLTHYPVRLHLPLYERFRYTP